MARVFPDPPCAWVTIRSALGKLKQRNEDTSLWRQAMMTSSLGRLAAKLPPDPAKRIRLRDVGIITSSHFTLARCAWDLPAPTLAVTGQQPDALSGAIHPSENRKFTLAELRRLFGLPDDYALTGTVSQGAERICRMVTPFVTRAIAESVFERVLQPHRRATS